MSRSLLRPAARGHAPPAAGRPSRPPFGLSIAAPPVSPGVDSAPVHRNSYIPIWRIAPFAAPRPPIPVDSRPHNWPDFATGTAGPTRKVVTSHTPTSKGDRV